MYEAIKNFNKQFLYEPVIENQAALATKKSFIVVGMGGSALAAKLLYACRPDINIDVRTDYGLPPVCAGGAQAGLPSLPVDELKNKLIILSSYSGNTEETIDAFKKGKDLNLPMAVIAVGGELLKLAIENKIPYVQLPDTGIQPRSALGFSMKALLKILGEEEELKKITELASGLNPADYEQSGKELALKLKSYVPVIYSSSRNSAVAYNWKIKLNETGKIPAFYNVLPELNHNEMTGFDPVRSLASNGTGAKEREKLNEPFFILLLKDVDDDPRIAKRMQVLQRLYQDRNLKVETLELEGGNIWRKVFSSLLLADWTAYYTAKGYGVEAEQVPLVEEFKKLISQLQ